MHLDTTTSIILLYYVKRLRVKKLSFPKYPKDKKLTLAQARAEWTKRQVLNPATDASGENNIT